MPLYALTWPEVVEIAPELSTVPVATQDAILADVALEVRNPDWTSEQAKRAAKRLAAHIATLTLRDGIAGPVSSESVDGVSVSYAIAPAMRSLDATSYGQEYQRILDTQIAFRVMVLD